MRLCRAASAPRKRTLSGKSPSPLGWGFPEETGYTLIAHKKDDVLSDKYLTEDLTKSRNGDKMIKTACAESEVKKMYTKDKAQRITLRLNEEQFEFVKKNADVLGVSPSEFLRMVVNSTMATTKILDEKIKEGAIGRENDKADKHNII